MLGNVIAIILIIAAIAVCVYRFTPFARKKATVKGCGSCNSCSSCNSEAISNDVSGSIVSEKH